MENWLWKRLWTCRKTDWGVNKCISTIYAVPGRHTGGSRGIALLIHNLWLECGWWSKLRCSHFTPWKNSQYGLCRMLGGPQDGSAGGLKI